PTFGGGANSLVTELLGDDAIISSDFGGNAPYEKMKEVARICFKHWLSQSNVLFIIGGKSNNTDIFVTFRAMADALREHFGLPYRMFGFDSDMSEVVNYARMVNEWMKAGGRAALAAKLGIPESVPAAK